MADIRDEAKPVPPQDQAAVTAEWDEVAQARYAQLAGGRDLSYQHVLLPCVLRALGPLDERCVLDVGCGSGFLTAELAETARAVVGIDPSEKQIELARRNNSRPNTEFHIASAEDAAEAGERVGTFDLVASHMTLMDVPDLDSFLCAVRSLMQPGGCFVFAITHPFFWPRYAGYANAEWFRYQDDITIDAPLRISLEPQALGRTTHHHRPLAAYAKALGAADLRIETLFEPMPSPEVDHLYPAPWEYPRYLVVRCLGGQSARASA